MASLCVRSDQHSLEQGVCAKACPQPSYLSLTVSAVCPYVRPAQHSLEQGVSAKTCPQPSCLSLTVSAPKDRMPRIPEDRLSDDDLADILAFLTQTPEE